MTYNLDSFGINRPITPVSHRDDEYQEAGFKMLLEMQACHFWYVGRHKFLLGCLKRHLKQSHKNLIDLGGGVGGWIKYLIDRLHFDFEEIALGDSSNVALMGAKTVLPNHVSFYQVDLILIMFTH